MNRFLFVVTLVVYAFGSSAWAGNCGSDDILRYKWLYAPNGTVVFDASQCTYTNNNNASPKYMGEGRYTMTENLHGTATEKTGTFDLSITKVTRDKNAEGPSAASYKCSAQWGKSDIIQTKQETRQVPSATGTGTDTVHVDVNYKTGELYTLNLDCGDFQQYLYREVNINPPVLASAQ
jgi:hypothetical protein